jgi:hypothetical protein
MLFPGEWDASPSSVRGCGVRWRQSVGAKQAWDRYLSFGLRTDGRIASFSLKYRPNVKGEPRAVRHKPFSSTDTAGASARGLAEIATRSRALALTTG